eukprot:1670188-Rhodomonas_salina.1
MPAQHSPFPAPSTHGLARAGTWRSTGVSRYEESPMVLRSCYGKCGTERAFVRARAGSTRGDGESRGGGGRAGAGL